MRKGMTSSREVFFSHLEVLESRLSCCRRSVAYSHLDCKKEVLMAK